MSDFVDAARAMAADMERSILGEALIAEAAEMARQIADFALARPQHPWTAIGWTRRRWVRARKRWNAERRMLVYVLRAPHSGTERDAWLETLASISNDWRAVMPAGAACCALKLRPSWRDHVNASVAGGRVPRGWRR